jgi:hypothetical protein
MDIVKHGLMHVEAPVKDIDDGKIQRGIDYGENKGLENRFKHGHPPLVLDGLDCVGKTVLMITVCRS